MDVTAGGGGRTGGRSATRDSDRVVLRHSLATRLTHWTGVLAFFVLVASGLQIFDAAPYLDASNQTDPARRVLSIGALNDPSGNPTIGAVQLFGLHLRTTGLLGVTDDGSGTGARTERAFPGWITLPAEQDLAGGRRWHLFFAWVMSLSGLVYLAFAFRSGNVGKFVLRRSDLPKLWPMQAYYLGLRREPPHYGKYNPLQKAAYTVVLFGLVPLIVLTGLALSPGVDAFAHPLVWLFGGRQFARLWHFTFMSALLAFLAIHVFQVVTQGFWNNMRSMITGRYRLGHHDGEGV